MRVLVLITDRANPPLNATRVRNYFLWQELKKLGAEERVLGIDLDPKARFMPGPPHVESEFVPHVREEPFTRLVNSLQYSFHQWPYSPNLAAKLDRVAAQWNPQIIHAEELRMAPYLPALRGLPAEARQTVAIHNVESDLLAATGSSRYRWIKPLVERLHLENLRKLERKAAESCDVLFAYSPLDKKRYQALYPQGNWSATRGGADVRHRKRAPEVTEPALLLVGSWAYHPNREGLEWFLERVRPKLSPETKVTVAGSGAAPELKKAIAAAGYAFVDTPAELGPLYQATALSVVPLFSGSGTRGRILESLSYGRMVVTTAKGAEGLDLAPGEGILLAESSDSFAHKINLSLKNFQERGVIADAGYRKALLTYDWKVVAQDLVNQWSKIASGYYVAPDRPKI